MCLGDSLVIQGLVKRISQLIAFYVRDLGKLICHCWEVRWSECRGGAGSPPNLPNVLSRTFLFEEKSA